MKDPLLRTRHRLSLCAAACLLVAGGAAQAQIKGWYVVPTASMLDPSENWLVDKRKWGYGVRLGAQLSPNWDVQFGVNRVSTTNGGDRYTQTLATVDALWMFGDKTFKPFLLAGVGAQRDFRGLRGVGYSGTSPNLSLGAGFQWMWSPTFGMQADIRRVHGFLRDDPQPGFSRSANNYVNLGLIWTFGAAPAPAPAPRVAVAPPPPPPPPPPQRITLEAGKVFAFGSARIEGSQPELDRFAEAMAGDPGSGTVEITGHTDRIGSAAGNRKLSQARADAVKTYLVTRGVPAVRLTTKGVGSAQAVVQCNQKQQKALIECLAPNRRVELTPITVTRR